MKSARLPESLEPPPPDTILERRLEEGRRRIEDAKQGGIDIQAWEDFWLSLLAEYEAFWIVTIPNDTKEDQQ